jgi:uncharacterized protein (TIGR03435 family)
MLHRMFLFALVGGLGCAQPTPAFEVATVKPGAPEARGSTIRGGPENRGGQSDPNRIEYVNHSLQQLVLRAYDILPFELSGPAWMENARFDITAKLPRGTRTEQIPAMLQSLLVARFHIKAHREAKEQTVFNLTVARSGARLKESTAPADLPLVDGQLKADKNGFPPPVADRVMRYSVGGRLRLSAGRQDAGQIARMLSGYLGARVADKTGLTGKYDFTLEFEEDNPSPEPAERQIDQGPAPSLLTAIQDQLGLRLNKTKGQVDVLVIDRVDRTPEEN